MKNLTLPEYQKYVDKKVIERAFDNETVSEAFMMLSEEIGEFAKATRKSQGMRVDKNSKVYDVEEEAADVFWYLIVLCNKLGIDLEEAFMKKEEKNQNRTWS